MPRAGGSQQPTGGGIDQQIGGGAPTGGGAATFPKPVGAPRNPILPGGGQEPNITDFPDFDSYLAASDEFELTSDANKAAPWEDYVIDVVTWQINNAAKILGLNPDPYLAWFEANELNMINGITPSAQSFRENPGLLTVDHLQGLGVMAAWWLMGQRPELKVGINKEPFKATRGGSGRRGPSASEIRASFDIDELSRNITELWNGYLLEEPKDARGIAKAYVEQIVRNPEQKLDFKSYVLRQIEGTAKYQVLSKNKGEFQSYENFIGPLLAQATAFLGAGDPGQVSNLVGNAAQLASSPDAFVQRLGKERQVTASAPFIQGLEAQVRSVKGVFRNA